MSRLAPTEGDLVVNAPLLRCKVFQLKIGDTAHLISPLLLTSYYSQLIYCYEGLLVGRPGFPKLRSRPVNSSSNLTTGHPRRERKV